MMPPASPATAPSLPLTGVRVLDFTRVLAGPFCTMLLADMGADVIKVESVGGGDDTRAWGPPWFTAGGERFSTYYLSVNRGKRSLTLDLKHPDGQAIARRLAAQSAIVVENFRPGAMAAFGLGYEALAAENPALVMASITGYGQYGPYAERPGYDFVVQGQSGLMSITGEASGPPHKVGVAVSDVFTGLFAATGILGALRGAETAGHGQHLDIALLDSQLAALVNVASAALETGRSPRFGNAHASIVPYQPFRAADADFTLAVGNDRQFRALCGLLGVPAWADDSRYATNAARVAHRETLCAALADRFAARPAAVWVAELLALGIPAGEVHDVPTILDSAHVAARGLVHTVELAGDLLRTVGSPVQFGGGPLPVRLAPPRLGEHTDLLLGERLGLSAEAIARLRADGVV
jgi:crotonobetainyl-CoA:carnitine CoA-transferase CaiB-like acyl-CoA transferase